VKSDNILSRQPTRSFASAGGD